MPLPDSLVSPFDRAPDTTDAMISAEAFWSSNRDPSAKTLQLQSSNETDRHIAISPWGADRTQKCQALVVAAKSAWGVL